MTKIALVLAIALATAGSAYAKEAAPVSVVVNPASITLETSARKMVRYGDAAPASVVVNDRGVTDFSSAAAIGATASQHISPRVFGGSN